MAKDKENEVAEGIIKKYGDIMSFGNDVINKKRSIISISPRIDLATDGGVPEGSLAIFAGQTGCGKSTTALQLLKNALDIKNVEGNKRKAFYFDVEHRLKPMNLKGIDGLNPNDVNVISSSKDTLLMSEDYCDIATELMKQNNGAIIVLDSTSSMCPRNEYEVDTNGQLRTTQPKVMSHWCKKIAPLIQINNIILVLIQHLIMNTSGKGEWYIVDGGEKLKYQADVKLISKTKPEQWNDSDGNLIGQKIEWTCLKSALSNSGKTATSFLRYGKGLDMLKETLDLAVELGIVVQKGAWFNYGERKWQGAERLYDEVVADPELAKEIGSKVRGLIVA